MKRRAGLTLVEVLVAIFIMGIGLLAIMTLFPLGLINYGQAMQDDRAAQAAANAAAIANMMGLRSDPNVNTMFNSATPPLAIYVDPWYAQVKPNTPLGTIPRIGVNNTFGPPAQPNMTFNPWPYSNRPSQWFGLTDDYDFTLDGTPASSGSVVTSAGYYTWCYMLRRPPEAGNFTDLSIVIYKGRSTDVYDPSTEQTIAPIAPSPTPLPAGTTTFSITPAPNLGKTGWILDPATGQFYRVISNVQGPGNSFVLETQTPLKNPVNSFIVMVKVIEVIEKGYGG